MNATFDTLYDIVRDLPVVDWHNHLDMRQLAEDRPLGSLYATWVAPDPYKHRAMRICGEPERLISGDAPEAEKWAAWTRTLPKLVGNPLFDWAKAELALLGIRLDGRTMFGQIENVSLSHVRPSAILRKVHAEVLCPCVGAEGLPPRESQTPGGVAVVPSLRLNAGEEVSLEALERFDAAGCRVVDISVDDANSLLSSACCSSHALRQQADNNKVAPLFAFAAAHGWTLLLHLGALRETSSRLRAVAGPTGGFAGMRAPVDPAAVARFLDALEREGALPHTILLTLNPEAHAQLAVLSGSFTREGSPGHVQLGPAWWWCDHAHGVSDVLEKTAAYGVLSTFVGMTTDSRSILSLARHDWFRRVLCRWIADKVAAGDYPDDPGLLLPMLEAVCYGNAKRFFQ